MRLLLCLLIAVGVCGCCDNQLNPKYLSQLREIRKGRAVAFYIEDKNGRNREYFQTTRITEEQYYESDQI